MSKGPHLIVIHHCLNLSAQSQRQQLQKRAEF